MEPSFEILEHTADIGFHAWGSTVGELFENAANALMAIAAGGSAAAAEERAVKVSGCDYEALLVNWLNEILYLFDSGQFAPAAFSVDAISPHAVEARISGEPRDPARHGWRLIVKAVTFHQIEVAERNGRWEAQVFLDV